MEFKDFDFRELKAVDEQGTFEGALSTYGNVDQGGDVCDQGCFTKTLQEGGSVLPLLWSHDTKQPIGSLVLTDTPTALRAKGKLLLSVPQAAAVYEFLKAGIVKGMSIGYSTIKSIPGENGVRRLKELRLFEGSLVLLPMNDLAVVSGVKHMDDPEDLQALQDFRNASREIRSFYDSML